MYAFCIGIGLIGEKAPEIRVGNTQKLEENDRFCMNGVFRGASGSEIGSNWLKKYAGCDYNIRVQPNPCFWVVLKDLDFHKNPDIFVYFCIFFHSNQNRNPYMQMASYGQQQCRLV